MKSGSTLYVGSVMHRRIRPRPHRLRYRVFWMLLDLDEIDDVARRLPIFSHNRFNLVSFHTSDHGDGSDTPLIDQVRQRLKAAGLASDGAVRLLCMPRVFGYGFNPLSVYFCHDRDGALAAVLYEVHNTFGERHTYLFPVESGAADETFEHRCAKAFHVSPFLGMDLCYLFRLAPVGDRIAIAIRAEDDQGPVLTAALSGSETPLTNRALLRLLVTYPLMTLKVIAAIHWHAGRMLLKGFRVVPHPGRAGRAARAVKTSDQTP